WARDAERRSPEPKPRSPDGLWAGRSPAAAPPPRNPRSGPGRYPGEGQTIMPHPLTPELRELQLRTEEYAREHGLDFFEIVYDVLDWEEINEVAAYGGYPARYPHWRFGLEDVEVSRSYAYGRSNIYEMVIDSAPTYAYLLAARRHVDEKPVMAHVCGHADFFKNKCCFAHPNRKMVDEMANHATRVRRYMEL